MSQAPAGLICTRLADMTVMHPQQIEKVCHKCGHVVGIYPSGQRALKDYPGIEIVCSVCSTLESEEGFEAYSVGSIEEIVQEARDSKKVGKT